MSKRNRKDGRRTGKDYVLPIVGKTADGKLVVSGVYEFHETYGMPLPFLFDVLRERDMIPDWINFYEWARKNGMKHSRILSKLKDPIEDSYGRKFAGEVLKVLNGIFS